MTPAPAAMLSALRRTASSCSSRGEANVTERRRAYAESEEAMDARDLDDGTAVRGRAPRLAGDAPPGAGRRATSAEEGSRGTFSEDSDADGRRGRAVDGRATGIGRAPAASASRTSVVRARSVTSARRDASSARNARSSMVSPAVSRLSAFQSTLRRITDAVSRDALGEATGADAWGGRGGRIASDEAFVARAECSSTPREGSRRRTRRSPLTNTLSFPFPTSASMPNDSLLARSGSRRRSSAMSATRVVGRAETNGVDQHAERARNTGFL